MSAKEGFPQRLYVRIEENDLDDGGVWYNSFPDAKSLAEDEPIGVGVYEFVELGTVTTEVNYIPHVFPGNKNG